MKFRRVNDTTINCIITQEDLKEYGLHLDDLFERKKEAEEFFRGIMAEAARQENFNLESEFTSMKIAVLPDHSISLTLSEDPDQSAVIRRVRELAGKSVGKSQTKEAPPQPEADAKAPSSAYMFRFDSMKEAMSCAGRLCSQEEIASSLYRNPAEGCYYMIVERTGENSHDFERLVLSLNEFGTLVTGQAGVIAHFCEHAECILRENAAQILAAAL